MSELDKLVQHCQQGELAAFTNLFRRYEARIASRAILHKSRTLRCSSDACPCLERIKQYCRLYRLETWPRQSHQCRDRLRRRCATAPIERFPGKLG